MKLPLILIELDSFDVTLCSSLGEAELEIEPPDVDCCGVFDAEGLVIYKFVNEKKERFLFFEQVKQTVKLSPSVLHQEERLRSLLLEHLRKTGKPPNDLE